MPHTASTMATISLDLASLRRGFADGSLTAAALIETVIARRAACGDDAIWIAGTPDQALRRAAADLDARRAADPALLARLPLFGIPFAVKDNIDVAGMPTTAACPAFAYTPAQSAPAVARLVEAGAIMAGKANLDQFATGLVGVRSPYGVPRNAIDARFVPGGSSSGSAVAVARGLVSFALGTDTAGSGRVPAAFNNIVGLKPTRGIISTSGVVPACRSLDCVSILALTAEDAAAILDVAAIYDESEPFSRPRPAASAAEPGWAGHRFRFGVPLAADLRFFGDGEAPLLFARATEALTALGGVPVMISFAPFRAAAELLYSGPWVAERMAAVETLYRSDPDAMLPVIRTIIGGADKYDAVATFKAMYRLAELRRAADAVWRDIDVLLLPTAGTIYTVADVAADPIQLNTNLGYYTNFVNLLDLAAIAVPAGFRRDGMPFGVTLMAPAYADARLAELGAAWQWHLGLPLGVTGASVPAPEDRTAPATAPSDIPVAVAGAHLSGMPLNHRLVEFGCRLIATTRTAPEYRMFLIEGEPVRPGLLRVATGGTSLEVEIWSMSAAALGTLVAEVAPPLAIGTVRLADGGQIRGFLCEADATATARDISGYGSWRRFIAGGEEPVGASG